MDRHRDPVVLRCSRGSEGSGRMRGPDEQTNEMFSYLSPEQRVRADHPLRAIRAMTARVFAELSARFTMMYSDIGRASIPPGSCCARCLKGALIDSSPRVVHLGQM